MPGILDLDIAMQKAENDPIWALRGKAIQSYAALEQSLCILFAHLGSMSPIIAATIFFKISSADVRNKILEKLFKLKYGSKFNLFFNSFLKQINAVDKERNAIVHWSALNTVNTNDAGEVTSLVTFKPPAYWGFSPGIPSVTKESLILFSDKCEFYMHLFNIFCSIEAGTQKNSPTFDLSPWLDVFNNPIVYPPPSDHPLLRKRASVK